MQVDLPDIEQDLVCDGDTAASNGFQQAECLTWESFDSYQLRGDQVGKRFH